MIAYFIGVLRDARHKVPLRDLPGNRETIRLAAHPGIKSPLLK
jgi:hypothetical protein